MKIIEKDITTVTSGVICQQVNCRKVMGAGLALQIAKKWPQVRQVYLRSHPVLGGILPVQVEPHLIVCNIYGQDGYGRGRKYTNYGALTEAFQHMFWEYADMDVYIPEGMGCGLAGGDWKIISYIIEQWLPDAIICRRP